MRLATFTAGALLVGATFLVTRAVYSQEGGGGPTPEQQAEMMKKMMELATPGAEHKEMAKAEGSWDAEMTHWETPGGEPKKSKGSCTSRMVLGGRFMLTEFKGDMGGMQMEGIALEGFDNQKKEWWSVWVDSMGTGNMRSTGGAAKDGVRTLISEKCDWGMGPMSMRMAQSMKDANSMSMEMWCTDASGKEQKAMEIAYTRKK